MNKEEGSEKRQVLINAIMAAVQILIVSGVLFILYRFLLKTIGVEQLGIWSLVLAATSVTQIGNFGLSASVVKYVARYIAHQSDETVSRVIQTAALSVALVVGGVLLISYPLIRVLLKMLLSGEALPLALSILPYALFAFWLMMLTGIFHSGIDGYQRVDQRSYLMMGGTTFHLLACFVLVPSHGLLGLAYARVLQNLVVLISSWLLLRRLLPVLPIVPYKWHKKTFREIIGYGMSVQITAINVMFNDPVTKALLTKFGGLSMVGYYEMASRMVAQFRALIAQANLVLVPFIATLQEKEHERIRSVYMTSYQLLFYLALPLYSLIVISAPLISELWIGRHEVIFILLTVLLAFGWFANTLNVPAYVANMGTGELRWNVIGQISVAVLNSFLGFTLGFIFGGIGVVAGWVAALALGSSVVYISYHIKHRIPFVNLLPKASRLMFSICLLSLLAAFLANHALGGVSRFMVVTVTAPILFAVVLILALWFHPMREKLAGWASGEVFHGR